MKEQNFLNLKLGNVEQYSMIVNKEDLLLWKKLNWKEYNEVKLPEGEEESYMLYGEFDKNIETLLFNKPIFLRDTQIIGKTIVGIELNLGTYGMGGPGFLGFLLDNDDYLVYAVWNSSNFVFVNNRIVNCSLCQYNKMKPWVSNFSNLVWDDLTDYISKSKIVNVLIEEDKCEIVLEKEQEKIVIKFVRNDKKIPRKVGRFRNAYKKGLISDYLLFQHKNANLIV